MLEYVSLAGIVIRGSRVPLDLSTMTKTLDPRQHFPYGFAQSAHRLPPFGIETPGGVICGTAPKPRLGSAHPSVTRSSGPPKKGGAG